MAQDKGLKVSMLSSSTKEAPQEAKSKSAKPLQVPITGMLNEVQMKEFQAILDKYKGGVKKGELVRHILSTWLEDYKAGKVDVPVKQSFSLSE